MSQRVVLDTNVYIQALRNAERLRRLKRFLLRHGTRVHLASVVAMELRAGARTRAQQDAVEALLQPYLSRQRTLVPEFEAWVHAGRVLAELATKRDVSIGAAPQRLTNDALLAVSCRDADAKLVTGNAGDFATIKRFLRGFSWSEMDWESGE